MIAAKNGVVEMVDKILELFPSRIKDVNAEGKNIFLLAVEYRQKEVVWFLRKQKWLSESELFRQVGEDGSNVMHLAARHEVESEWFNPPSISTEILWYEFMKRSVPHDLLGRYNSKMEIPDDIFRESHKELMKSEVTWATKTSQACSVVTTLVASASFATRTNVPGGYDDNGYAILMKKPPVFQIFVYSSILAFFCSIMSTICFLSIAASRSQSVNSWRHVPYKLSYGMSFMFVSIVSLLVSFCAADFFMLDDKIQESWVKALLYYMILSSGIIFLVVTQLRTFFGPTLSGSKLVLLRIDKPTIPIEYRRSKNKENSSDLNHQN